MEIEIPDQFDANSVRFDDGKEPPGWAQRNGFSVRITSRDEARRNAIMVHIYRCLCHPAYIWSKGSLIFKDVFSELSRAFPPLKTDHKNMLCAALRQFIPPILEHAASQETRREEDEDFFFILRQSRKHLMWDLDTCEFCGVQRSACDSIVVFRPCGHVLCDNFRCFTMSVAECPTCAREGQLISKCLKLSIDSDDTPDDARDDRCADASYHGATSAHHGASHCSPPLLFSLSPSHSPSPDIVEVCGRTKAIKINLDLHIPNSIIDACLKKICS